MIIVFSLSSSIFSAGTLTVDFSTITSTGSPDLFGGNSYLSASESVLHQQAGFTVMRIDGGLQGIVSASSVTDYWNNHSNPANWSWGLDNSINNTRNAGLRVLLIVSYCPNFLQHGAGTNAMPSDLSAWKDIVTKVYNHVKGRVDYLEVWNEPTCASMGFNITGLGYPDKGTAYAALFDATYDAVRNGSGDKTIPIGGPAANEPSWGSSQGADDNQFFIDRMLDDTTLKNTISFISIHHYGNAWTDEYVAWSKNMAASHGRSSIQVYNTEWNADGWSGGPRNELNNGPAAAIPFVGRRLVQQFNQGLQLSIIYACCRDNGGGCFSTMSSSGALYPKINTYRLMSKTLKLGKGNSQITMRTLAGTSNAEALGAINCDGEKVVCLVNEDTINSNSVTVQLNNLGLSGAINLDIYQATATNQGTSVVETRGLTVNNGSVSTSIAMPACSVIGLLVRGGTGVLPASNFSRPEVLQFADKFYRGKCAMLSNCRRADIFDLHGRYIKEIPVTNNLVNWNGFGRYGTKVGSGPYFIRLVGDNDRQAFGSFYMIKE
jgi:hypothetical protein